MPLNEVLDNQQISTEKWRFLELGQIINNNAEVICFLARRRLLHNQLQCVRCQVYFTVNRFQNGIDGIRWRCNTCGETKSIRHQSFFSGSVLTLTQCVTIVYFWTMDVPQTLIQREAAISKPTSIDWCNFCREICELTLANNPQELGGFDGNGDSIVVEIDESKYFHRKYHRGQWREGHWVFGAVERNSGKCCLIEVPNRQRATLEPIILQWILPGSLIMSDGFRSYDYLDQLGGGIYQHQSVVHKYNFVDPHDANVYTQNIESLWTRAKRKLRRQHGTTPALFPSYLHEFLWREKVKGADIFSAFIIALTEQYIL